MKQLFTAYDVDENGMLELDELQKMFANFNVIALKEDIKAFFERVSGLKVLQNMNGCSINNEINVSRSKTSEFYSKVKLMVSSDHFSSQAIQIF